MTNENPDQTAVALLRDLAGKIDELESIWNQVRSGPQTIRIEEANRVLAMARCLNALVDAVRELRKQRERGDAVGCNWTCRRMVNVFRALDLCEATADEYRKEMLAAGIDISPCRVCGCATACIPDGMPPVCIDCAPLEEMKNI